MWLTKYNASGNDFLIFYTFNNILDSKKRANLAKKICNRHSGIGADGLVIIMPHSKYAYKWDFYNSDGSKADMCGNASRCVAHYAYINNLAPKKHSFLSGAGEIKVEIDDKNDDIVEVNFGKVKIKKDCIDEYEMQFTLLDSGIPHLVSFIDGKLPKSKNKMMENLRKKYNANVNFAKIISKDIIHLSTYERGVEDITLACGTGMAATYYLALMQNKIHKIATLIPPSNEPLYFKMQNDEVYYKGKVERICDIKLFL
ncbi:diaminopimelate epimerase [Helicobacter sp. MIT 99-5507]|uniref:diaminopimelate epimerase n=1 Tax=Helicobacter sp. MIT 99-5507 TaxID=152489 RepID=UPI000E1E8303|nr:diaminopimelate epimerase [Helicobacter sp. MIT 99-5507]RDU57514.1 diaminopimelate epimerase [Helicobacter sp. MIT 99-5507]